MSEKTYTDLTSLWGGLIVRIATDCDVVYPSWESGGPGACDGSVIQFSLNHGF